MRHLKSLFALLVLAPAFANAEQRQFGNTVYTPLPGWIAGNDDDGKLVFLSDLPNDLCQFCYINLSASRLGRGDVGMYVAREATLFVDKDDQDSVTLIGEPSRLTVAGHNAAMQSLKVGSDMQVVIAVSLGDRFEMFGFQGGAYDDADLAQSMSVLQSQVVPFFEKLTFVSTGASPVLPVEQPGDMDGVWWGWSTSSTFGLDMMMRQQMDYRTLIFWPDGFFYDGTPPDGMAPIDKDALQAKADPNFGIYQKSGASLTLIFATGETETLTVDGNDLGDGSKTLAQAQPVADGLH